MSIAELRKHGLDARRSLYDEQRARLSLRICGTFLRSSLFYASKHIACYLSTSDEVDTSMIFERAWDAGKHIFAPVIDIGDEMRFVRISRNTRLERNHFHIWEPTSGDTISPRDLDVVVTPLAVFDAERHRIGMGGGYYDRCFYFLNHDRKWRRNKLAGLAFECQKTRKIPANPWDIRLYRVFTEAD